MMKPTFLKDIAHWGGCAAQPSAEVVVLGASVDSRLTRSGDLFFALPGARVDGHCFLGQAHAKGAKAAVVQTGFKGDSHGLELIYADDVLAALKTLARRLVEASGAKIVAVTGSVGKTTTKEFIAALLRPKFAVIASPGNQNSQIGLPLTILNETNSGADVLVLEMGMTHAGDIAKLVDIAPPDVAVITAVTLVHACNFDSLAAIARAKGEIFRHARTSLGVYHLDSDVAGVLKAQGSCGKCTFSQTCDGADYFLACFEDGMRVFSGEATVDLPPLNILGAHNRQNFLAAALVANHLGVTWPEIAQRLPALSLPERRLQVVEKGGVTFVNDSYNACELSVKAALTSLPMPKAGGKRIAVIGEMLELGQFSQSCHRAVGEHALACVDRLVCLGAACEPIVDVWHQAGRQNEVVLKHLRTEVVEAVQQLAAPGDVVLLKGSRAKELWKVLDEVQ